MTWRMRWFVRSFEAFSFPKDSHSAIKDRAACSGAATGYCDARYPLPPVEWRQWRQLPSESRCTCAPWIAAHATPVPGRFCNGDKQHKGSQRSCVRPAERDGISTGISIGTMHSALASLPGRGTLREGHQIDLHENRPEVSTRAVTRARDARVMLNVPMMKGSWFRRPADEPGFGPGAASSTPKAAPHGGVTQGHRPARPCSRRH